MGEKGGYNHFCGGYTTFAAVKMNLPLASCLPQIFYAHDRIGTYIFKGIPMVITAFFPKKTLVFLSVRFKIYVYMMKIYITQLVGVVNT